jgi:hypothetical protein
MQCGWKMTRSGLRELGLSLALGCAVASPDVAAESEPALRTAIPESEEAPPSATLRTAIPESQEAPPSATLDRLLTLPTALNVESGRRGGATRAEWHARFEAAEKKVESAKAALEESLGKLDELAGEASNWKVAAPGVQIDPDDESPLNYGLRQEIRRRREDVERAERELRELVIEANLAGIPETWYRPD